MENLDIDFCEYDLTNQKTKEKEGKIAIFRGALNSDDPIRTLDTVVNNYVGHNPHNQFIEIHLDNPWVRVLVFGINNLGYREYKNEKSGEQEF